MTKTIRWREAACAAVLAFGALAQSAQAQPTAAQQSAMRANCRSDFMSHCSGVSPGGKDALACLQKNVERLSPGCQAAVHATLPPPAHAAAPPPPPPAPAAPAASAAPPAPAASAPPPAPAAAATPVVSAPPPRATVHKPMPRHPAAAAAARPVAPPPAAAPAAPTAEQQNAMRSYCRNDFMSHCRGVTPGGKDALSCLQRNVARLSAGCRQVVSATMHAPATERATPVATAPAEPPAEPAPREGLVPGGILISKACARYVLMHCRGMALEMGRKVACLVDYVNAGHFVGPRCKAALRLSGHLR